MSDAALRFVALGRCVMCEDERTDDAFVGEDRLFGIPGRFAYRTCRACGTVFQDPQVRREDIPGLYPASYYTHERATAPPQAPARSLAGPRDRWRQALREAGRGGGGRWARVLMRSRFLRERASFGLTDELIPRASDRRALEVGPGSGGLLALLGRAGWPEVEGLDFDPAAASRAQAHSGRTVRVGPFPDADLPESAFDLVVMVHVFEHLPDPRAALARLRALLTPAGRAVLIGPNPRGLGVRLFGRSWIDWDPPRHLVLPPIAALRSLAGSLGLRVARARTRTRVADTFSCSRALRDRRPPGPPGWRDRLWLALGTALAGAGLEGGEEMVVVLETAD